MSYLQRPGPAALLRLLVWVTALAFAVSYLAVTIARVRYPYTLDFIEEGIIMQSLRVAQGLPVYVAPGADYVPTVYAPLYPWLGGVLLALGGPAYLPLRLLSFLSTLTSAALIYLIPRREGSDRLTAFAGAALFLAGYRIAGGGYELARVDPLFVSLTLSAMFIAASNHQSRRGLFAAGLLMALAIWTKQNGLLPALVVGGYLTLVCRRRAWPYAAALLMALILPALALQIASGGWFLTYVLRLAYDTPLSSERFFRVILVEIPGTMAVLLFCGLFYTVLVYRKHGLHGVVRAPWILFTGAALAVTVASRTNVGGNLNVFIMAYALLCLAPGLLAAQWLRDKSPHHSRAPAWLLLLLLPQFALTLANPLTTVPATFVPTPQMCAAGDRLVQYLAQTDGEVWVMMHPFYGVLAGKGPAVHVHALWHARARATQPLPSDLVAQLESNYYAVIIGDESLFEREPDLQVLLEMHYQREPLPPRLSPLTLTGIIVRPDVLYVPR